MDQNISVDSLEDVPKNCNDIAEVISAESVLESALAAVAASEQATATPSTPGDLSFGPALVGTRSFSQDGDAATPNRSKEPMQSPLIETLPSPPLSPKRVNEPEIKNEHDDGEKKETKDDCIAEVEQVLNQVEIPKPEENQEQKHNKSTEPEECQEQKQDDGEKEEARDESIAEVLPAREQDVKLKLEPEADREQKQDDGEKEEAKDQFLEEVKQERDQDEKPDLRGDQEQEHLIDMKEEAAGTSFLVEPLKSQLAEEENKEMEFSKNYSDDLMGQNDGHQHHTTTTADLADFEMPAHSGSSSGSEATRQQQQDEQPKVERKSSSRSTSTSSAAQAPTSHPSYRAATTTTSSSAPNLSAVKDLITSSYSRVSHVFQWERPLETGMIFGVGLTIIMTLTFFSIISVFAYSALGVILASALIRLYKAVCKTLNRSSRTPFDHIWDKALGLNVTLSPEKMHQLIDTSLNNLNASLVYFKQVLLFEDKYATFKFAAFMYLLSYIGAWFNGMTLITIGYLSLFSVPILYQKNKTKIDQYLKLANGHISTALSKVTNRASSLVSNQTPSHQD